MIPMENNKEKNLDGIGQRVRLEIEGESYYLIGTRNTVDGGIDYFVTTPDMNKATGKARRMTAERICEACSQLSRVV